ncbi:MAG TPA: ubiquitin-like protein Pup [Candidatus Nanoarchaeia archaeon]|nr:ubiquitin-like protein Pup [Candidatus Nanoarchaeia archaeon]
MAQQEQKKKPSTTREEPVVEAAIPTGSTATKVKEDLDDLLDEIDEVLEENAEEFVRAYVQKGGQ